MIPNGSYYQCKHVKQMTPGQCFECLEEKNSQKLVAPIGELPMSAFKYEREGFAIPIAAVYDSLTPIEKQCFKAYIASAIQAANTELIDDFENLVDHNGQARSVSVSKVRALLKSQSESEASNDRE